MTLVGRRLDTCGAYSSMGEMTQHATTLYVFPPDLDPFPTWLGALDGSYDQPLLEKCCAVCSTGSYAGTAYTFATDAAGNNPATCKSFSLRFPTCLLYTSPSPRDKRQSRMPSSA